MLSRRQPDPCTAARRARRRACAWSVALLVVGLPPQRAGAAEVRVGSRTIGEGYVIIAPGPESQLLRRRRLVQYVNLGVYDLLPPREVDQWRRDEEDGQLELVASMRLRQEFGDFLSAAGPDSRPLLESVDGRQIDLMYGYLQGRRLGGFLDLRAGRQFETSGLDWYAFDGGWTRIRTPAHLAVEVFGGMQVNAAHMFGWPTWGLDGTSGREPADRAGSPMTGAALALLDIPWIHARVAYRRTFTPASINRRILEPTGAPDGSVNTGLMSGVDQEIVSATLNMNLAKGVFTPFAAVRFNLGTLRLDDTSVGFGLAVSDAHTIRAQYLRTIPSFDLDSIFNLFALEPFEDVRLSYSVRAGGGWTLLGRGSARIFRNGPDTAGSEATSRLSLGWGGAFAALWQRRRFAVRTDSFVQGGEGGLRAGGSVDGQVRFVHDRIGLDLRAFFTRYTDDQVPERDGYGLAFQLGADFKIWDGVHLTLLAEEMLTPFLVHAFRGLASLSVEWDFRAGRRGS
jgi:hypothetical protein